MSEVVAPVRTGSVRSTFLEIFRIGRGYALAAREVSGNL